MVDKRQQEKNVDPSFGTENEEQGLPRVPMVVVSNLVFIGLCIEDAFCRR